MRNDVMQCYASTFFRLLEIISKVLMVGVVAPNGVIIAIMHCA